MKIKFRPAGPKSADAKWIVRDLATGKRIAWVIEADDDLGRVVVLKRVRGSFVYQPEGGTIATEVLWRPIRIQRVAAAPNNGAFGGCLSGAR